MDQQDSAYPGAPARSDQGRPAGQGWEQKGGPAPIWEGAADGVGRLDAAQDAAPRGQTAQDHAVQDQPAQGWGAPVPDSPSPGWGTTAGHTDAPNAGTGWGAPQQSAPGTSTRGGKGNWIGKKGLLVGGAAVVVAAAAGAGAYAAGTGSGTASANNGQGTGSTGQFGPGGQAGMTGPDGQDGLGGMAGGIDGGMGMDGGPGGLGMGAAGLNAAVHSEYVVLQDSSYVTMAGQTGTVTEMSGTSMTVKSEDGFSRTYTVGSDVQVTQGIRQRGGSAAGSTLGLSNVTSGASVRVTALKDSGTYTAQAIQLAASGTATTPNPGTSTN